MMSRRNPRGALHPDLFGGQTHGFRSLEDLTDAEIEATPLNQFTVDELSGLDEDLLYRMAKAQSANKSGRISGDSFDDDQWEALDDDTREEILDNDGDEPPASRSNRWRAFDRFYRLFRDRIKWAMEPEESERLRDGEEQFDDFLGELDMEGVRSAEGDYSVDELIESWTADGYTAEQVEAAILEALHDNNNWSITEGNEYGGAFFKTAYHGNVYIEAEEVSEAAEGLTDEDVKMALHKVEKDSYIGSISIEDLEPSDYDKRRHHRFGTFEYNFDPGPWTDYDPDWEKIEQAVEEALTGVEPEGGQEEPPALDPKRVVHRFKDGAYVYDLVPADLPAEGRAMGHCVGRPGMGYGRAVHAGEIKILSLRTEAGRSKFTIEAKLYPKGQRRYGGEPPPNKWDIVSFDQIKGKANRLPGWDLGKSSVGPVKRDEVEKIIDLCVALGLDPAEQNDLRPGLFALEGKKQNPGPARQGPACGLHGEGCTGFCVPYRHER